MKSTLSIFTASFALVALSGCASSSGQIEIYKQQFAVTPPTTEWLEQEETRLTELVKASNRKQDRESLEFIETLLNERRYQNFVGERKIANTQRSLTLNWGNTGRGGAALRMPAYIHTLGPKRPKTDFVPSVSYDLTRPAVQTFAVAPPVAVANTGQGYSHYEMSRWKRFCNHGLGMDKRDWEFVRKEGVQNVPVSLLKDCNPPKNQK